MLRRRGSAGLILIKPRRRRSSARDALSRHYVLVAMHFRCGNLPFMPLPAMTGSGRPTLGLSLRELFAFANWPLTLSILFLQRQLNDKCRSLSDFALYVNRAVVVINYSPCNRKSKPVSLLSFCGEERFKYPGQVLFCNPLPGIGYLYFYVILVPRVIHRLPPLPGTFRIGCLL